MNEGLHTITLKGMEGAEKIKQMMEDLRNNPVKELAGYKVLAFKDYEKDTVLDIATGAVTPTGLPKSNVLYYQFDDNAWCCVRPSGTEPLVRVMIEGKDQKVIDADAQKLAMLIEKTVI